MLYYRVSTPILTRNSTILQNQCGHWLQLPLLHSTSNRTPSGECAYWWCPKRCFDQDMRYTALKQWPPKTLFASCFETCQQHPAEPNTSFSGSAPFPFICHVCTTATTAAHMCETNGNIWWNPKEFTHWCSTSNGWCYIGALRHHASHRLGHVLAPARKARWHVRWFSFRCSEPAGRYQVLDQMLNVSWRSKRFGSKLFIEIKWHQYYVESRIYQWTKGSIRRKRKRIAANMQQKLLLLSKIMQFPWMACHSKTIASKQAS